MRSLGVSFPPQYCPLTLHIHIDFLRKTSFHGSRLVFFIVSRITKVEKKNNDSSVNLKGGGQLATKEGDGEQMCGMTSGLGSVSGCPRSCPWQRRHGVYGHKCMQVS